MEHPEGSPQCPSRWIPADDLEQLVWDAVSQALKEPAVLAQEYERRKSKTTHLPEGQRKQLALALKHVQVQENRLIDAYKNEVIELEQLRAEMGKLKARRQELERQQKEIERQDREAERDSEVLNRLESFCQRVSVGLQGVTWGEKQKLLRLLIDRVVIDGQQVSILGVIPVGQPGQDVLCPIRQ